MRRGIVIGGGVVAFALLCALCLNFHLLHEQAAVEESATQQMPDAAVLTAPLATDPLPALDNRKIKPLVAQIRGHKIALSGELPDLDTKESILDRAKSIYGEENIIDELTVYPHLHDVSWLVDSDDYFPPDLKSVLDGKATFEGSKITLDGTVKNTNQRDLIEQDLKKQVEPNVSIQNNLLIAEQPFVQQAVQPKPQSTAPTTTEVQTQLTNLLAKHTIEFETNGDQLTKIGQQVLDEIIPLLNRLSNASVVIEGHTDSLGYPERNLDLSKRRAESVKSYLLTKGIAAQRITTQGFGATRPIANNNTRLGRSKNRRIEFKLGDTL